MVVGRSDWMASQEVCESCTEGGLNLTFLGLRHAHASFMLAASVDLKETSDRLGHSASASLPTPMVT
jgi:integrase